MTESLEENGVLEILLGVKDPEIPTLSIVDMGIVRGAKKVGEELIVTITPTYSGCPAMDVIEKDIVLALEKNGVSNARVEFVLSPPWTSDWITEEGRKGLIESGIAPPGEEREDKLVMFPKRQKIACPFCESKNTKLVSEFGSTACKALYNCGDCGMPFDYFKRI